MLQLTGKVLDIHDDIGLHRFREILPDGEREKVASGAELFSPEELEAVSDHRFGAVFHSADSSIPPRRSFLLTTPEHVKLSTLYFVKAAEERIFPVEVRAAIAAQIHHGAEANGVDLGEILPSEKLAEFQGWVDEHGDWAPGDNFIDCSMHEPPPAPEVEKYAFSKEASGGLRKYMLPVETAEQVLIAMEALTSKTAMEDLGLDADELRKAASSVKYAAETLEVTVPDSIVKLACVDERPRADVESLLRSRMDYVNPEKRASKKEQIKTAMQVVLSETKPAALVSKIALFDGACGIGEKEYRRGCARPFDVVFQDGRKQASEDEQLIEAVGGLGHVKAVLGEKIAAEFAKAPKATFEKQSRELKSILLHART